MPWRGCARNFRAGRPLARGRPGQRRRRHPAPHRPLGSAKPIVAVELTGIDANRFMLDYAAAKSHDYPEISYQQFDIFSPEFQAEPYDVLTCSLFCHHFTDDELVPLLRQWQQQAQAGRRHQRLAPALAGLPQHQVAHAACCACSYLVQHDAPLSVARAFRRPDWKTAAAPRRNHPL